jgi:hypothetical protein
MRKLLPLLAPFVAFSAGVLAIALPLSFTPTAGAASIMMLNPLESFAGVFEGDGLRLDLKRERDELKGVLIVGDQQFPVTARAAAGGIAGTFTSEGYNFEFTARFDGDQLLLTSDDEMHRLARVRARPANPLSGGAKDKEPKNPLTRPAAGDKPREPEAEQNNAVREFPQAIRHPLGVTLHAPQAWKVQSSMGSVVMIPDDAAANEGGPNELYLLLYAHAGDARSVRDQSLMRKISEQIRSSLPNLSGAGDPELFQVQGRDSALLRMKGRSDDGRQFAADVYVTVHEGVAVGLLGLGEQDVMRAREKLARRMFEAMSFGPPAREQRLVGRWSYGDSYSDPTSGFSMATQTSVVLDPGGRYTHSSRVAGGNESVTGSSGGESDRGLWFADQNTIIMLSESGESSQVAYTLSNGRLVTTDAESQRQIWNR